MGNRTELLILFTIWAVLSILLCVCAKNRYEEGRNLTWAILCALLYVMTGAVYEARDMVKIYSAIFAAILFGGSRLIPLIIVILLAVHIWVLLIGPIKKPADPD